MTHLSELRKFRKIASEAVMQFRLTNPHIVYIDFAENAVYKIMAREGAFLLRIHAAGYRTPSAVEQELELLALLNTQDEFDVQIPQTTVFGAPLAQVDGYAISLLSWQKGRKKIKSIRGRDFESLGRFMANMHNFVSINRQKISFEQRDYWSPDNLIGERPILGSFEGLETIRNFNRDVFEAGRTQTLSKLTQHVAQNPQQQGIIHADLHLDNVVWQADKLLPIDFDDSGLGSFLHDLSIPIINMPGDNAAKYRERLLNTYCQTRNLSQNDLDVIDDYILARHIAMQGWYYARRSHPEIKKYQANEMAWIMNILRKSML